MLQKTKKITIGFLFFLLFLLVLGVFLNFFTRRLIKQNLTSFLNQEVNITGYFLNPLSGLSIKKIEAEGILTLHNFRAGFGIIELLKGRSLRILRIDSLYVNLDKLTGKSVPGSTARTTSFTLPVIVNYIHLKKLTVKKNDQEGTVRDLNIKIEGTRKKYTLKLSIDNVNYTAIKNTEIYAKFHVENNRVYLENLSAQGDSLVLSDINGLLSSDSLRFSAKTVIWKEIETRNALLHYSFLDSYGDFRTPFLKTQGRNFQDVYVKFINKKDTLVLKKIHLKFKKNSLDGEGHIILKGWRFKIIVKNLQINEQGVRSEVIGKIEGTSENFEASAFMYNTFYKDLKLGHISLTLQRSKNYFILKSMYLQNNKSNLTGYLVLKGDTLTGNLKGIVHLEDFKIKGISRGTAVLELAFNRQDTIFYTNSFIGLAGVRTDFFSLKDAWVTIVSRTSQIQNIHIFAESLQVMEYGVDSLIMDSDLEKFSLVNLDLKTWKGTDSIRLVSRIKYSKDTLEILATTLRGLIKGVEIENYEPILIKKEREKVGIRVGEIHIGDGKVYAQGVVNLERENITLNYDVENLTLKGLFGIYGNFSSRATLTGDMKKPSISMSLTGEEVTYRDNSVQFFSIHLLYENNKMTVDSVSIQDPKFCLSGKAQYPLIITLKPVELKIEKNSPFYSSFTVKIFEPLLFNQFIGDIFIFQEGLIYGSTEIYGTLEQPNFEGNIYFENLSGIFIPLEIPFDSSYLTMTLEKTAWNLENINFRTPTGSITGKGTILNHPKIFHEMQLYLMVKNVEVYPTYDLYSRVSGTLDVFKTGNEILVKGDLLAEEADLYAGFKKRRKDGQPSPSPLRININIHSNGNTYLENELAEIEFKGDLNYKFDGLRTILSGEFTTIQGTFLYIDRVFDIYEGRIFFDNSEGINPELDIKARTEVDSFTVYLELRGTLEKPEVTLYSEPTLSEPDIVSLLSFGRPLREIPLSVSDMDVIKSRAFNIAEDILSRNLKRKLRIRELEIGTGLTGEDPHFTVGFYLSKNLFFRYTHDFIEIDKDIFYMRYRLYSGLGIYAEKDKEGAFSLGLEYEFEF